MLSLFRKPIFWLAICVLFALVILAYPIYVIRPFRYQGSRELAIALAVVRFRPILNLFLVATSFILSAVAWRQSRWLWARWGASICALLVLAFGFFGTLNVYELMFHPIERPSFSEAAKSKLGSNEAGF